MMKVPVCGVLRLVERSLPVVPCQSHYSARQEETQDVPGKRLVFL